MKDHKSQSRFPDPSLADSNLTRSIHLFRGLLQLTNFHEDFRDALPYWLNQAFSTTQDRVERAVQVDQVNALLR